jgi:gliding motility-associated-like protein
LNNQLYTITGQYSYTLPILNRFGGDSVHVLNLTIVNPNNIPLDYSIVPKLKDTLLCFQPFVDILLPKITNVQYTWLDDADSVAMRRIYHDTFQIVRITQGCFERLDSFQIKLIAKPLLLGLADTIICKVPFNTKLTAKNANWIRWNDGDTSLTKSIVTLGKYLYQAGNICGIVGDSFVVRQGLVPQKIIKDSIVFCEGKIIEVNATQLQSETFKYQWDGGSKSPIFSLKNGGIYRLTTSSFCGSRTDSVVAIEEFCGCKMCIPNAFTPTNSDGLNDGWIPRWDCSEHECHIQNGVYQIYNRWGEKIADNSIFMPWDGKYKGQVVQEGLYIYKINAKWDDSYPKSKRIIQSGYILVLSGVK